MVWCFPQGVQQEQNNREDSKNSIQQTAERLLSKPTISKPNSETIRTRLDILLTRWDILRADVATRTRGVESKLRRVSEFLGDLEELSSWASTTRELLEKQESGGYSQEVVDPKVCYIKCFCKGEEELAVWTRGLQLDVFSLRHEAFGSVKLACLSLSFAWLHSKVMGGFEKYNGATRGVSKVVNDWQPPPSYRKGKERN